MLVEHKLVAQELTETTDQILLLVALQRLAVVVVLAINETPKMVDQVAAVMATLTALMLVGLELLDKVMVVVEDEAIT